MVEVTTAVSSGEPLPRENCWICRRPACVCLCEFIVNHPTQTNFILLAHQREARSKTSTGYLAHRSLAHSRYIVGYDFSDCPELTEVINDPASHTYLLFPAIGARPASALDGDRQHSPETPINIIVIEATWAQSLCILARAPLLQSLPAVTLDYPRTSRFKFRNQPHSHCLSTIEAIAFTLQDLGEFNDQATQSFLRPFLTMVERQIEFQKINSPRYHRRWETTPQV